MWMQCSRLPENLAGLGEGNPTRYKLDNGTTMVQRPNVTSAKTPCSLRILTNGKSSSREAETNSKIGYR